LDLLPEFIIKIEQFIKNDGKYYNKRMLMMVLSSPFLSSKRERKTPL
jgi:hypothetical protein